MSTELMTVEKAWSKKGQEVVRGSIAPDLNQDEFNMLVALGTSLGANPFTREIWAVKYGNRPAQIFLGRDFYRRKAQEQPEYNGHQVDAIYSNDEFKMIAGQPEHSYQLTDRGELIGAYAVVYRSDNQPYFVTVNLNEYSTGKALWNEKPATMIKKVAEAQALRGAFQGIFQGTYDESEAWRQKAIKQSKQKEILTPEHARWGDAVEAVFSGRTTVEKIKERWDLDKASEEKLIADVETKIEAEK